MSRLPQPANKPSFRGINVASAAESGAGVIELRMMPTKRIAKEWVAFPGVEREDVPRLMREGFFWSAENVLPAGGYMSKPGPDFTALGFCHERTWAIAEKPYDGAPQWRGKVKVMSHLLETLINFRIQDLSVKNVFIYAWNGAGRQTYNYDYEDPIHNYNCIYDNKPLKGWWPWPKERSIHTPFASVMDQLFKGPPFSCPCRQCEEFEDLAAPKKKEFHQSYNQPSSCIIL